MDAGISLIEVALVGIWWSVLHGALSSEVSGT